MDQSALKVYHKMQIVCRVLIKTACPLKIKYKWIAPHAQPPLGITRGSIATFALILIAIQSECTI